MSRAPRLNRGILGGFHLHRLGPTAAGGILYIAADFCRSPDRENWVISRVVCSLLATGIGGERFFEAVLNQASVGLLDLGTYEQSSKATLPNGYSLELLKSDRPNQFVLIIANGPMSYRIGLSKELGSRIIGKDHRESEALALSFGEPPGLTQFIYADAPPVFEPDEVPSRDA